MRKIKIIAAIGKNYELGKNNDLIWKLKEDLKFFRNETMNKTIVMKKISMVIVAISAMISLSGCHKDPAYVDSYFQLKV